MHSTSLGKYCFQLRPEMGVSKSYVVESDIGNIGTERQYKYCAPIYKTNILWESFSLKKFKRHWSVSLAFCTSIWPSYNNSHSLSTVIYLIFLTGQNFPSSAPLLCISLKMESLFFDQNEINKYAPVPEFQRELVEPTFIFFLLNTYSIEQNRSQNESNMDLGFKSLVD